MLRRFHMRWSEARSAPTAAYAVGLMLIACLSTAVWLSTIVLLDVQDRSAVEVNVAGRQRMLSQRIVILASDLRELGEVVGRDPLQILQGCIGVMRRGHLALLSRDPAALSDSAAEGIACEQRPSPDLPEGEMSKEIRAAFFDGSPSLDGQLREFLSIAAEIGGDPARRPELLGPLVAVGFRELPSRLDALVLAL